LFDSCSDAHIECEHAAPDLPTGNASPTAELLRSCVATEQRGTKTLPFQSSVDDIKMRILPVEQALQQCVNRPMRRAASLQLLRRFLSPPAC
jgi:hypothetical protein